MIVRLWEREGHLSVLERSEVELERARQLGGAVFDVTLDPRPPKPRKAAEVLLHLSRRAADLEADPQAWGEVERARRRVVKVL